jgi:glutathione S-transferase
VRLLLAQLGIPFERREVDVVDRSNRKELLGELNPALRVPTLVFDDGRALAESNAILWYLADSTQYVPTDPWERAKVLQWLFFEQYSHEPQIAVARFWLHVLGAPPSQQALAEKHRLGYLALDALEQGLDGREFLVGDRYSIADVALYAYTHVAGEAGFELERYPAIRAWLPRVAGQPGHVTIDA